ncbi:hypothetical protein Btru_011415 [Bulinus truncatus]|nr:hypothetical protein Btru_011415 [Bulinus truncatus]
MKCVLSSHVELCNDTPNLYCLRVWLVSILTSLPPLQGWVAYSYIPNSFICFCEWSRSPSYAFFMVGFCFCLPCSVMTFCNLGILRAYNNSKKAVDNFAEVKTSGRTGLAPFQGRSGTDKEGSSVLREPALQLQNASCPEMTKNGSMTNYNNSMIIHDTDDVINKEVAVNAEIDRTLCDVTDNSSINNSSKCFVFSQDSLSLAKPTRLTLSVIDKENDYDGSIPADSVHIEAETFTVMHGGLIEADVKSYSERQKLKLIDQMQIGNTRDQLSPVGSREQLPQTMTNNNLQFPLACDADSEVSIMGSERKYARVWKKSKSVNLAPTLFIDSLEAEVIKKERTRSTQTTYSHCVVSSVANGSPVRSSQHYRTQFKIFKSKKSDNRKLFQNFRSNRRKRKLIRVFPLQQNDSDNLEIYPLTSPINIYPSTSLINSCSNVRFGHVGFQSISITTDSKLDLVGPATSDKETLLLPSIINSSSLELVDKQLYCLPNTMPHSRNITLPQPLDESYTKVDKHPTGTTTIVSPEIQTLAEVKDIPSTASIKITLPVDEMTSSVKTSSSVKRDVFLNVPLTKPNNLESRPVDQTVQIETKSHKNTNSNKSRSERRRREEFQLAGSLLVMILLFIVCWFPYCVSMFVSIFSPGLSSRSLDLTSLCLGYFNSCLNPVIYGAMNKKFKEGYRRLLLSVLKPLRCKRSWDVTTEYSRRRRNDRWTVATMTST